MSETPRLQRPRKGTLVVLSIVIAGSWLSLIFAYGVYNTGPWDIRYGMCEPTWRPGIGWLIEGARSLILVLLWVYVLDVRFQKQTKDLFSLRWDSWKQGRLVAVRLVFLTLAAYFFYDQLTHHLTRGPDDLIEWTKEMSNDKAVVGREFKVLLEEPGKLKHDIRINYLAYLPYSLINYLIIAASFISVSLLGAFDDYNNLLANHRQLSRDIKTGGDVPILTSFNSFRNICQRTNARYIDVLASLSLAVHFDYWIGKHTLSSGALVSLIVAFVLVGTAVVHIFIISTFYQSGYDLTKPAVGDSLATGGFRNKYNVLTFLRESFTENVGGVILLFLIAIPLSRLLPILMSK